jgi:uncharacterized membrane protein YbhN (UPF0104 family)
VRRALLALKIAAAAGVLGVVLAAADLDALGRLLGHATPGWLAAAVAVLVLQNLVLAARFRAIVTALGRPLGARFALAATFIGVLFNQALPSAIGGDALRAWQLHGDARSWREAVTAVLLDRAGGIVVLALLAAGAVALEPSGALSPLRTALVLVALLGVGALALIGAADRLRFLPHALRKRLSRTGLPAGARALSRTPLAAVAAAWSAASHLLAALAAWLLAAALGVDVAFGSFITAALCLLLVTMIPLSYAGWGVREAGAVWLFSLLGVSGEQALAISLLFGFALALAALPGLPFWLAPRRERASRPAAVP